MKTKWKKLLGILLAAVMIVGLFPMAALADDANTREYGSYDFTKISNPSTGSGEPDGINTNDIKGFEANRLNSYAWAVASRGDYIYIGTNRTLFGSALNAVVEIIQQTNPDIDPQTVGTVVSLVSGGDVPVNLAQEDYIPQIIKFDVKNGSTEVIYQPATAELNGTLYYVDQDTNIIPGADVSTETASFRSVVEFNGNLYFGSLGINMLQLVRVDEDDNADVVFETIGLYSSLRAGCIYDDGAGATVYFGGQDATNAKWREVYKTDPDVLPIVIRKLDPATAGTDNEDWSKLIADFEDFGEYAKAKVYRNGGGNVWDLCSYNGKLYLIMAYDGGWAMFRGEKGGAKPNEYGWTWTEIVGDNSIYDYPLAMDASIATLNKELEYAYSCSADAANLFGAGLLESTATPYVYKGKMYIGTFDNATTIQSETVVKALVKLSKLTSGDASDTGPTLEEIFAPIYYVLSHPQRIWVMDENETITPVASANSLLSGTTNDYVWRFIEHDGKLFAGTFDSSTAYNYFLFFRVGRILEMLRNNEIELSDSFASLTDNTFLNQVLGLMGEDSESTAAAMLRAAVTSASENLESFLNDGDASVEQLLAAMNTLKAVRDAVPEGDTEIPEAALNLIDWLLSIIDIKGLQYWVDARNIIKNAETGFDILATTDGSNWSPVVRDGLGDPYNYGARTFTVYDEELYVGTANPYYGAQLWKLTDNGTYAITVNGGTANLSRAAAGETITITAEDRDGATFTGWTVVSGGVILKNAKAKETYFVMPANDVEIQANFSSGGFVGGGASTPGYAVIVLETQHGKIVATPTSANAGATIKLTATPDKDYELDILKVTDEKGNKVPVTANEDGTYSFKMPACSVKVKGTFELNAITMLKRFRDLDPNAWYFNDVYFAVKRGLMNGIAEDLFGPNDPTTRAMIVTILYRMEGEPAVSGISPFEDVEAGQWYTNAIIWAQKNEIVEGYDNGKFGPKNEITREQFATILFRYAKYKGFDVSVGEDTNVLSFNDAFEVSSWAMPAIQWACGSGLMLGDDLGNLLPGSGATRAQAAAFIHRFVVLVMDE